MELALRKSNADKDGPIRVTLAGVTKSRLESHFNFLLKKKGESNEKARGSSGGNCRQQEGEEADLVMSDRIVGAWHFSSM